MSRFGNKGRFDTRYELDSVYESMREDLQQYIGQYVPWYRFDRAGSTVDPIYDVGASSGTGGRKFFPPFLLPVISAGLAEGVEVNVGQGEYTTDVCHLVVSYDQAEKAGLRNMAINWRLFMGDRFIWNNTVFQVRSIQVRGPVGPRYEVLGIDGWQVNAEELINDVDFLAFAGPGDNASMVEMLEAIDAGLEAPEPSPELDTALTPAPGAAQLVETELEAEPTATTTYVEPVIRNSRYDSIYGRPS
jgi:hypothetical protein